MICLLRSIISRDMLRQLSTKEVAGLAGRLAQLEQLKEHTTRPLEILFH